jgi:hypothetical protein
LEILIRWTKAGIANLASAAYKVNTQWQVLQKSMIQWVTSGL